MKVVSARQMREIESLAYREGAQEESFMETAGQGVADFVKSAFGCKGDPKTIYLFCGKGNNAGDAYAAGLRLLSSGYKVVAWQAAPISTCSPLCQQYHFRFLSEGGSVRDVHAEDFLDPPKEGVILDGLLGTGFQGAIREPIASLIRCANRSGLPIVAIDIPSGINGNTGKEGDLAIEATFTVSLGLPKQGIFLQGAWSDAGELAFIDFGLEKKYIEAISSSFSLLYLPQDAPAFPLQKRCWHKYQRGFVAGLAGSPGMGGAAILSSWAALKGGAGIVRLFHSPEMKEELTTSPYEIIKVSYDENDLSQTIEQMQRASAVFIGPGLGRAEKTKEIFRYVLKNIQRPVVIDADGLNFLAQERSFSLPEYAILTPHQREMERLLNSSFSQGIDEKFLDQCRLFSEERRATIILKGAPTFIFSPGKKTWISARGVQGMATAGSGDVLSGLIASLLAQGLSVEDSALLGTYLHQLAGEFSAQKKGKRNFLASDIIESFSDAFIFLERKKGLSFSQSIL